MASRTPSTRLRSRNTRWIALTACLLLTACTSLPETTAKPTDGAAIYRHTVTALAELDATHGATYEGGRVPLHYLSWGDEEGVPLIYLHGTYGAAQEIAPFAEQLVEAGYRLIAVDWYGHGKTPIPKASLTIYDFAEDLRGLLDTLGIERAVLSGHSRGGTIATGFYDRHPDRVLGLILIDGGSSSHARSFGAMGEDGVRAWLRPYYDTETGLSTIPTYSDERKMFLATWNELGQPTAPLDLVWILAQAGRKEGRWSLWRSSTLRWLGQDAFDATVRGFIEPSAAPPFLASCTLVDPIAVYRDLDVPMLLMDATADEMDWTELNLQLAEEHRERIRYVEYVTGHYLFREEPDGFVEDMVGFLSRLPRR